MCQAPRTRLSPSVGKLPGGVRFAPSKSPRNGAKLELVFFIPTHATVRETRVPNAESPVFVLCLAVVLKASHAEQGGFDALLMTGDHLPPKQRVIEQGNGIAPEL